MRSAIASRHRSRYRRPCRLAATRGRPGRNPCPAHGAAVGLGRFASGSERVKQTEWGWATRLSTKMTAFSELRVLPIVLPDEIQPGDSLSDKLIQALKQVGIS